MNVLGITFAASDLWLLGICGALTASLIGYHLNTALNRANSFRSAAATFRNRVLAELKGLYPVSQYWDIATFQRFSKSIIEIESAAAEFRFSVARKDALDTSIKEYSDYCKQITWTQCAGWSMYPTMSKAGEIDPREKFGHLVKSLLSFAEEK